MRYTNSCLGVSVLECTDKTQLIELQEIDLKKILGDGCGDEDEVFKSIDLISGLATVRDNQLSALADWKSKRLAVQLQDFCNSKTAILGELSVGSLGFVS